MDWKKLFNPVILERGYDYYRNGNAEILSSMADEVNAAVSGSDDYEVNIYFSDGEIDDMYCDCPYASDGNNCKHMAAVLYLLEDLQSHSNLHYTDIESLIEWKHYFEAFEIVSYYYDEILTTDLDDDGDISYFQNCCLEMLSTIADESDIKTRRRLFNSAFRKMDTSFRFFNELYFDFIRRCFDEAELKQ